MSSSSTNEWGERTKQATNNFSDLFPSTTVYNKKSAELLSQPTFYTDVSRFGPKLGTWHRPRMPSPSKQCPSTNESNFHVESDDDDDVVILEEIHMSEEDSIDPQTNMCQNKPNVANSESQSLQLRPSISNVTTIPFLDSIADEDKHRDDSCSFLGATKNEIDTCDISSDCSDDSIDLELYGRDHKDSQPVGELNFSKFLPSSFRTPHVSNNEENHHQTFDANKVPTTSNKDDIDVIIISDTEEDVKPQLSNATMIQGNTGNERIMPQLIPLNSESEKQDSNNNISCDGDVSPISELDPIEVINIPSSPEMPRLIPFTSETEELPKLLSNSVGKAFTMDPLSSSLQPKVVLKKLSFDNCQMVKEELEKSSYSLSQILKVENDFIYDPDIDMIDGLNFFSFMSQTDMDSYVEVHRDNMPFHVDDDDDDDVDSTDSRCGTTIIPTKTSDITQIKGWKSKHFAPENQIPFYQDPSEEVSGFSKDYEEKVDISEISLEGLDTFVSSRPIKNDPENTANDLLELKKDHTTDTKGAFFSENLESFLELQSSLNVPILQKVNPNITPIPRNAPILSIGNLRKVERSFSQVSPNKFNSNFCDHNKERKHDVLSSTEKDSHTSATSSNSVSLKRKKQSAGIMASTKVLKKSRQFRSKLESPNSQRLVLRLKKETSGTSDSYKVSTISNEVEQKVSVPAPKVKSTSPSKNPQLLIKQVMFSETNCANENKLLQEFLTNLKGMGSINDLTSLVNSKKAYCNTKVISQKDAIKSVQAVTSIRKLRHTLEQPQIRQIKKPPTQPKKLVAKKHSSSGIDNKCKNSDSRGKRSIRLPLRFLDSAIMVPGSEWVSPIMSSEDYESYSKTKRPTDIKDLHISTEEGSVDNNLKTKNCPTPRKIKKSNSPRTLERIQFIDKSDSENLNLDNAKDMVCQQIETKSSQLKCIVEEKPVCESMVLASVGLKPLNSDTTENTSQFYPKEPKFAVKKSLDTTQKPNKKVIPLSNRKKLPVKLSALVEGMELCETNKDNLSRHSTKNHTSNISSCNSFSPHSTNSDKPYALNSNNPVSKRVCHSHSCVCKNSSRVLAYDVATKRLKCTCMAKKANVGQKETSKSEAAKQVDSSLSCIGWHNYAAQRSEDVKDVCNENKDEASLSSNIENVKTESNSSKQFTHKQSTESEFKIDVCKNSVENKSISKDTYNVEKSNPVSGVSNKFARIMILPSPSIHKTVTNATPVANNVLLTSDSNANIKLSTGVAVDMKKILVNKVPTSLPVISDVFYSSSATSNALTKSTTSNTTSLATTIKDNSKTEIIAFNKKVPVGTKPVVFTLSPEHIFRASTGCINFKSFEIQKDRVCIQPTAKLDSVVKKHVDSSSSVVQNSIKLSPTNESKSDKGKPAPLHAVKVLDFLRPATNQNKVSPNDNVITLYSANDTSQVSSIKLNSPRVFTIKPPPIQNTSTSPNSGIKTSLSIRKFHIEDNSVTQTDPVTPVHNISTAPQPSQDCAIASVEAVDEVVDVETVLPDETKQLHKLLTEPNNFHGTVNAESSSLSSSSSASSNESDCEESLVLASDDEEIFKNWMNTFKESCNKKKVMERHRRFLLRKLCNDLRKCEPALKDVKSVKDLLDKTTEITNEVTAKNLSLSLKVKILLLRRKALLKQYKKMLTDSSGVEINSLHDIRKHISACVFNKGQETLDASFSKPIPPFVSNMRKRLMKKIDTPPAEIESNNSDLMFQTNATTKIKQLMDSSKNPDILDMRMNLKRKFLHSDESTSSNDHSMQPTQSIPFYCADNQDLAPCDLLKCHENSLNSEEEEATDDPIDTKCSEAAGNGEGVDDPDVKAECQKEAPASSQQQQARHSNLPCILSNYFTSREIKSRPLSMSEKCNHLSQRWLNLGLGTNSHPKPSESSSMVSTQERIASQCPQIKENPSVNKVVRSLSKWYSSFGVPVADDVLIKESHKMMKEAAEVQQPGTIVVGNTNSHTNES